MRHSPPPQYEAAQPKLTVVILMDKHLFDCKPLQGLAVETGDTHVNHAWLVPEGVERLKHSCRLCPRSPRLQSRGKQCGGICTNIRKAIHTFDHSIGYKQRLVLLVIVVVKQK